MADVNDRSAGSETDEDPTEELEILPARAMDSDDDTKSADPICAANQAFEDQHLDSEIREANDSVSELSSRLRSRTVMMQSIQRELDRIRAFSESLKKEVESGKGAISEVTDELVAVRAEQNDVSEQLRRRVQQVSVLRDKLGRIRDQLAKKDAFIEELARGMDIADSSDGQEKLDSQQVGDDLQVEHNDASVRAACQDGQAQPGRLRMIVGRHDNKMTVHPVLAGGMSLGTSPDNDVQLDDAFVSYRHAVITETAVGYLLKDLDSSNGTWVNRKRIKSQMLKNGDLIDIGPLRFEFIDKPVEIQNGQTEGEVA